MDIKAGVDRIAVKMTSFYEDTFEHGNLVLHKDPLFDTTSNVRTQGEIVGGPTRTTDKYMHAFRNLNDFERIVFDFKSLDEEEYVEDLAGSRIYFVPMELVYALFNVVNGKVEKIQPGLDIVLCTPHYTGTVEEMDLPDGSKQLMEVSASGIVLTANPEPDQRIAYIAHVGPQNPRDPEQTIDVGYKVFRDAYTNYEYELGPDKYYVVRRENLGMIVPPETQMSQNLVDESRDDYDGIATDWADKMQERDNEAIEMIKHKKIFGFNG